MAMALVIWRVARIEERWTVHIEDSGPARVLVDATRAGNGLVFPELKGSGEELEPNRIMPEPTVFLDRKFPACSIIRPTETAGAALGAVQGLAASGLFAGQSQEFFAAATALAKAADAVVRS